MRSHQINFSEKSSLWNIIYGAYQISTNQKLDYGLDDALFCLQTWPLSQVDWPVQNSERLDIRINPDPDRSCNYDTDATTVFRYDEISMFKWNSNPFEMNGGSGYDESDPSAWLLPYWMARYYKMI